MPQQSQPVLSHPLLLLPGTLCDERVFAPLQARLGAIRTEVCLTTGARSLEEAAEQVLRQAPDRFSLLGFSLGGMVAMQAALEAPHRICGLVLVGTTPLPVPPERHAVRYAAVGEAQAMGIGRFLRERLWPDYAGLSATAEDARTLALMEEMAERLGHPTFALQTAMALGRPDFRPRLPKLTCPTLVLAGDADRLCPPAAQQALAASIPRSTCVLLPGAGHMVLLEKADEVASAVAAWFHALEAAEPPHPAEGGAPKNAREST